MDARLREQLLILMLIDSLRREKDDVANDDDDDEVDKLKGIAKVGVSNQTAASKELSSIAQRLIDEHILELNLPDGGNLVRSPLTNASASSNHHVMNYYKESTVERKNKKPEAQKKRKRMNGTKLSKTKLSRGPEGAGIVPQIFMMAFSSITTLIITLTIIHLRAANGSEEGTSTPALQPSSKSLRHRQSDHRNMVSTTPPSIFNSPTVTAVDEPVTVLSPSITLSTEAYLPNMSSRPSTSILPSIAPTLKLTSEPTLKLDTVSQTHLFFVLIFALLTILFSARITGQNAENTSSPWVSAMMVGWKSYAKKQSLVPVRVKIRMSKSSMTWFQTK